MGGAKGYRPPCMVLMETTFFSLVSSKESGPVAGAENQAERKPQSPGKAARQALLEKYLREAYRKAAEDTARPLLHGRIALCGLIVLAGIRGLAWWEGNIPGYSVFGMHFLTTTSDIACMTFALPFFITGIGGQCVQVGCVGPMMTLIFAMAVVDMGALCAFLLVATPRPLSPGARSIIDVAEATVGVWDWALLASVALQLSLLTSCWRVYKELRLNGLYPPGSLPAGLAKIEDVSILEMCCEADDVKFLTECDCMGGKNLPDQKQVSLVVPEEVVVPQT